MKPEQYWKIAIPLIVLSIIFFWDFVLSPGLGEYNENLEFGTMFFRMAAMPLAIAGLVLFALKQKIGYLITLFLTAIGTAFTLWVVLFSFSQYVEGDHWSSSLWFRIFLATIVISILTLITVLKSSKVFLGKPKVEQELSRSPTRIVASVLLGLRGISSLLLAIWSVNYLLVVLQLIFFPTTSQPISDLLVEIGVWLFVLLWGLADIIVATLLWRRKKSSEFMAIVLAVFGIVFVTVLYPIVQNTAFMWGALIVLSFYFHLPYLITGIWIYPGYAIPFNVLVILLVLVSFFWERKSGKKTATFKLLGLKHGDVIDLKKIFAVTRKPLLISTALILLAFLFYQWIGAAYLIIWPGMLVLAIYAGNRVVRKLNYGTFQAGIAGTLFALVLGIAEAIAMATLLLLQPPNSAVGQMILGQPAWLIIFVLSILSATTILISAIIGFVLGALGGFIAKKTKKK